MGTRRWNYASALPDPDWGLVVEMLGRHGESGDCRALRLLGTANARLHGHGRMFLEKAHVVAPNDLVSLLLIGDTYCPECDLCERGTKGRRSGDCQKALRHYTEAFAATFPSDPRQVRLSAADPHIFRKFAECLICSGHSHEVSSHRRKLPIHPGAGPIVIMVGSCDPAYESILQNYQPVLMNAFKHFSGLICSGGTRAGIGTLVGDIQAAFPRAVTTLGYLPHLRAGIKTGKIEAWVKPDKRYRFLLTTATDEFGPEQPLQYWTDLLAAGVEPYHVKVLGVNGGKIAALEYRMALALNAPVAVLEKSGREAARLLQNDDWGVAERLMVLPPETEMVRAYIRSGSAKMPRRLSRFLDRIARDVHEDYVKLRHKQIQKEDLSLSGWSRLPPELQDSNCQQAVHLADHLSLMGYALANMRKSRDQAAEFATDDIEKIAEIEHARYVVERFLKGWKWGEKKDVEKKINPTLVAWSKLPDKEKEKDRVAARSIPKHFAKGGVRIVRKEGRDT